MIEIGTLEAKNKDLILAGLYENDIAVNDYILLYKLEQLLPLDNYRNIVAATKIGIPKLIPNDI